MATWITHLIIADRLLTRFDLDRRAFCVGNIAPDCNIENSDWTSFTPPREVTHFMSDRRKTFADCEDFRGKYLSEPVEPPRRDFLLGYYSHLLTDVAFQDTLRDESRVKTAWKRVTASELAGKAAGMPESFDSLKKLIPRERHEREFEYLEALYLAAHPDSGYLTEILPLKSFPDYLDFLPPGAIARKVKLMALPRPEPVRLVFISADEFEKFVSDTTELVAGKLASLFSPAAV